MANPEQARSLLTAVSHVGGFRPAEVVGLDESDLALPRSEWGIALLHRTRPSAGKRWTDSGESHDGHRLKNRPT